jgi:hypothetical protein
MDDYKDWAIPHEEDEVLAVKPRTMAELDAEIAEKALAILLLQALQALENHDKPALHSKQHELSSAYQQALLARMYADEQSRLAEKGLVF